jgi:hypothetical protein
MPPVVAHARSRRGGHCESCHGRIAPGELVYKIDVGDRGHQTAAGNGLGVWVCASCAATAEQSA